MIIKLAEQLDRPASFAKALHRTGELRTHERGRAKEEKTFLEV
jgi:hypothetical protein